MNRLSKQYKALLLVVAALVVMAATIPAAIWLTHTGSAETGHARLLCEQHNQAGHLVYISPSTVTPAETSAKRCDTLTIVNLCSQSVHVAMFKAGQKLRYDGAATRTLAPQQRATITLLGSGHYEIGDAQGVARGELNVSL